MDLSTWETHGHRLLAELLNPAAISIAFGGNTHCRVVPDLEALKGFTSYRADDFNHSLYVHNLKRTGGNGGNRLHCALSNRGGDSDFLEWFSYS